MTRPNLTALNHYKQTGNMVEAGGVEPPSEKRYGQKPTCLAQFGVRPDPCGPYRAFAFRAQNEQETRPTSPMCLALRYGPKRFGQPAV